MSGRGGSRQDDRSMYQTVRQSRDRREQCSFFFFQAEDGIRDYKVTGVQTCALPIWAILSTREDRIALTARAVDATSVTDHPLYGIPPARPDRRPEAFPATIPAGSHPDRESVV